MKKVFPEIAEQYILPQNPIIYEVGNEESLKSNPREQ